MADLQLPLVGGVSKKALLIGGAASAAVIVVIIIRRRSSASAATTATTGATDSTSTDGTTSDYVDPGLTDTSGGPTYGATGYVDPNTGQWVYGATGTGQAAATSNQQWAQMAEQYLTQNSGADPGALSAALGKYLTGQAVTSAEESLIDQAIAVEGYPPSGGAGGYPPGIRTQSSSGGGDVTVPHVTGETAAAAHTAIARAGLKPVNPGIRSDAIVTSTTPAGGEQVPKGTEVVISVKAAAPAAAKVKVPKVAGETAAQAHTAIAHAGLVPVQAAGLKASAKVRSTTPAAGTEVAKASHVRINT